MLDFRSGTMVDLAHLVGKLIHVVQVLPAMRPLLQPLHAFLGAVGGSSRKRAVWPDQVRKMVACVIRGLRRARCRPVFKAREWVQGWGASDGSGGTKALLVASMAEKAQVVRALSSGGEALVGQGDEQVTVPAHQIAAVVHPHSRRQMKTGDVDFAMLPAPFYIRVALPPRVGGWWCDVHKDAAVKEEVEWFSEVVDLSILGCLSFEEGGGGG